MPPLSYYSNPSWTSPELTQAALPPPYAVASVLLLICRHVMHAHLTHLSEPSATLQGLTEQAAFFLLSTCIRSAEGRKRIVNEIVQTLSPSDKTESKSDEQTAVRRPASNPYKVQPGFPAPHKVCISSAMILEHSTTCCVPWRCPARWPFLFCAHCFV